MSDCACGDVVVVVVVVVRFWQGTRWVLAEREMGMGMGMEMDESTAGPVYGKADFFADVSSFDLVMRSSGWWGVLAIFAVLGQEEARCPSEEEWICTWLTSIMHSTSENQTSRPRFEKLEMDDTE